MVLLGDACHPVLVRRCELTLNSSHLVDIRSQPYRAQGAAMAIEDAAVLANLLSRISCLSQLKPLLEAYQDLRLCRASVAQESSRLNRKTYNLPDGPEQRERDENMRRAMTLEHTGSLEAFQRDSVADLKNSAEGKNSDAMFAYDADAEVDKWWEAHGSELEVLARSKRSSL